MKTYWVVNPRSANGATGKVWPQLRGEASTALGSDLSFGFTERALDATRLAREALEKGFECIVAVGGDGTVNEVVNGFFRDGKVINPNAALAVMPRGTGGDFRKTFGWDTSIRGAIQRVTRGSAKPMDVGLLEYTGHDGRMGQRYFANICSFGVSGAVDKAVNESSKVLGGRLSFVVGSMRALVAYRDKKVKISTDGGPEEEVLVTTLAVANGQYFGGGMRIAPQADPSDGIFDVTIWSGYGPSDFVLKSKAIYEGTHTRFAGTRTLRCKRISARSDQEVLLDVDGEQPGRLPCSMSVVPAALRVVT